MFFHIGDQLLPDFALEELAGFDRFFDQLRSLREHAAAADRVVADFAVAHVVVGGHADRGAVRLEAGHRALFHQFVEFGRVGREHRVAVGVLAETDAVEDAEHHRAAARSEFRVLLQSFKHDMFSSR